MVGDFSMIPSEQLSDSLKEKLNAATQRILRECADEVEQTLRTENQILDRFAQELLKRDELDYDEIVQIFMEYGKSPKAIAPASAAALLDGNGQPAASDYRKE